MKKVLSILMVLSLAVVAVFGTDKNFKLTTTVGEEKVFRVIGKNEGTKTYADIVALTADDLSDAPVTTTKSPIKQVVAATNRQSDKPTFTVTASATPLTCAKTATPMGYDFYVGEAKTTVPSNADSNDIAVFEFTPNGTQQHGQKTLSAQVNETDFKAAAAGDYVATITFTISGA